jgi:pyrimidine operon attenuation protein/uracil phosphoribosyltransferase
MTVIQHVIDDIGLDRTLSRLAHEILERNQGASNVAIIGLRTRGEFVARRLCDKIRNIDGHEVPLGVLDITLYRDDVRQLLVQPILRATDIQFDITGMNVVLVDDVLFTGRTIRAALDALTDIGRPATIQLAVLVDRGHRELPIRADYKGKTIVTTRGQEVRVRLKEVDGDDCIDLVSVDQ